MSGERKPERVLARILATLQVHAREGEYVFVSVPLPDPALAEHAQASVHEAEGVTYVLPREAADAAGLTYDFRAAWLSLAVHSALDAVGLTAAVADALAQQGIPCNVLAGFHHDHLLVPADRRDPALAALADLARAAASHPPRNTQ